MTDESPDSLLETTFAELRRIGLDAREMRGLAFGQRADVYTFVERLRALERGASWSDVFPDTPKDRLSGARPHEQALGPFDYADAPRGPAVFASLIADDPRSAAASALAQVDSLGIPIFGSGLVLDRGAPHVYVVLQRGASDDEVDAVVVCLQGQPGIANSYPVR